MEVKALVDNPFTPPYYPSHTHSTERAVRQVMHLNLLQTDIFIQVTEASAAVAGFEARHGFVLASRVALPMFGTKQDILSLFSDL